MTEQASAPPRRVVVVGGGFTGACAAVQLVRHTAVPLAVTVVDPAARAGRGLAYRSTDPDHRLNAPSFGHSLLPDDAWHFSRWVIDQRLRETDPESLQSDGTVYVRRGDFGRYLVETLEAHARHPLTGSAIVHRRGQAVALSDPGVPLVVTLADGERLAADLVLVATGNPPLRRPGWIDAALAAHPALHADAVDGFRAAEVAPDAAVALVGSGLTALDVLSSLQRRGHCGPVTVLSRHGLRPRPNAPPAGALAQVRGLEDLAALPPGAFLARFAGAPPAWVDATPPGVRAWLRALRQRVRQVQAEGGSWQQAFDELRDAVWQLWPRLPAAEQRRFLRTLRPWYDVHRFRSPPPNDALVQPAVAGGRVRFVAGRVQQLRAVGARLELCWQPRGAAQPQRQLVDVLVNCTGLEAQAAMASNPFLADACRRGWLRPDACGWGFEVDADGRAMGADGMPRDALRVLGPPSAGCFGDPLGAVFIGAQVQRVLPGMLGWLAAR